MSRPSIDPPLVRQVGRITGYLRGSGQERFPPDRMDVRRELADFMEKRTPALLDRWLRAIGPTLAIPEADWPRIKEDQALGRRCVHVDAALALRLRRLGGVQKEIQDHLLDLGRVAVGGRQVVT